jgi:hypothetical protein
MSLAYRIIARRPDHSVVSDEPDIEQAALAKRRRPSDGYAGHNG